MARAPLVAAVLLLAGCTDPMTYSDGIWPEAGSAQLKNMNSQLIGAGGPAANPGGHGARAVEVIRQYQTGSARPAAPVSGSEGPPPG